MNARPIFAGSGPGSSEPGHPQDPEGWVPAQSVPEVPTGGAEAEEGSNDPSTEAERGVSDALMESYNG